MHDTVYFISSVLQILHTEEKVLLWSKSVLDSRHLKGTTLYWYNILIWCLCTNKKLKQTDIMIIFSPDLKEIVDWANRGLEDAADLPIYQYIYL